ncbi:hypothetical protein HPP92_019509 [Vanilla planifolia]|uniref:DUF3741 domain-containing protein n=1 Tax=Vanilla planifolia TaxID=51239 RepID=A0A835Q3B3_VANPL|nr:hypothetical protein HPP92_019509 [Vanilla planifolia]
MGLVPPGGQRSASATSATAKTRLHNKHQASSPESSSQEIAPFRSRQHKVDLSMALALALSNSGKLQNIEIMDNNIMGRKIVLHLDGKMNKFDAYQLPSLSPSQIGEIAKGVQNLNMIITAYSKGLSFSRDSIDMGRELLKGAMDLQKSLKMLVTLQDASDYMVAPQGNKSRFKLLEGDEEDSPTHGGNQQKGGGGTEFSFLRVGDNATLMEQKQKATTCNERSSKGSTKLISQTSYSMVYVNHEQQRFPKDENFSNSSLSLVASKGNRTSQRMRIPNVIAKLMGLEELPTPTDAKKTEMNKAPKSTEVKEKSKKSVDIDQDISAKEVNVISNPTKRTLKKDEEEKGKNTTNKSSSKSLTEQKSLASSKTITANIRSHKQMDMNKKDQGSEAGVTKKQSLLTQGDTVVRKKQPEGRIEHTVSGGGKLLPNHFTKKPNASSVIVLESKHEDKSASASADANARKNHSKKSLVHTDKGLVLKQQKNANTIVSKRSISKGNKDPIQQSREEIQETCSNLNHVTEGKLQSSVASKKILNSEDIETHAQEISRTQSTQERSNSSKSGILNNIDIKPPQQNVQNSHNGKMNTRDKTVANHRADKKLIEQYLGERPQLNSPARGQKVRTSYRCAGMRKPMQVQSAQRVHTQEVRQADAIKGNLVEATVQDKVMNADQLKKQKSSILEELVCRWKEGNNKLGAGKGSHVVNLHLQLQQGLETSISNNLSGESDSNEIKTCNPNMVEETKTAKASGHPARDGNLSPSMHDVIDMSSQDGNSASQLSAYSCIIMKTTASKCSKESSEPLSSLKENKDEDPNKIDSNKPQELQIQMEEDQDERLREDENALKHTLMKSQNFLNSAQEIFQIKIPVHIIAANQSVNMGKDIRLVIDCANELIRRKGVREELSSTRRRPLATLKIRSLNSLIKEIYGDLQSLKYLDLSERCDYDLAECINQMIEKDIQQRNPDINSLWDFDWSSIAFASLVKNVIVRDLEKYVLNELLNELFELPNVMISTQ